jgi:hypothetical protein
MDPEAGGMSEAGDFHQHGKGYVPSGLNQQAGGR